MKILFICRKRMQYNPYDGRAYGLFNSASFVVNYLNNLPHVEAKVVQVNDSNDIDKEVTNYNPNIVVIEALWVTAKKFLELFKIPRHKHRRWVCRIHSQWSFLAHEGASLCYLNSYLDLPQDTFVIAPNTEELAHDLNWFGLKTVYLPNIYEPQLYKQNEINVGCFGSIRLFKNPLTQAIAAMQFADQFGLKLLYHINGDRTEQNGDNGLRNIEQLFLNQKRHKLIKHKWLSHEEFDMLVRQMDIGLQVSFTETFNIVIADFVKNRIPIVVSRHINWIPKEFQVQDENSVKEIVEKLNRVYSIENNNLESLINYNHMAKSRWSNFILGEK